MQMWGNGGRKLEATIMWANTPVMTTITGASQSETSEYRGQVASARATPTASAIAKAPFDATIE